jgi:hypothetical protein
VPELPLLDDAKAGRLLLVEGTEPDVTARLLLEADVFLDDVDQVEPRLDLLNGVLGSATGLARDVVDPPR